MLQEICANMFKMWCLLALADLNTGEFVVWKENELQGSNQSDQDPEIEVPLWNQCNQTRQKETICWERVGSNRCQTGSWSSWSSATLAFHTHFSQPKSSKKGPVFHTFQSLSFGETPGGPSARRWQGTANTACVHSSGKINFEAAHRKSPQNFSGTKKKTWPFKLRRRI